MKNHIKLVRERAEFFGCHSIAGHPWDGHIIICFWPPRAIQSRASNTQLWPLCFGVDIFMEGVALPINLYKSPYTYV